MTPGVPRFWTTLLLSILLLGSVSGQTRYFWDDPVYLVRQGARFPSTVDNGKMAAAFWQERRQAEGWPQSFLSVTVRREGDSGWTTHRNVLGPFNLVGAEAQFYSALLTPDGVFWVAVLGEEGQIILYRSDDGAATFREDALLTGVGNLLVPKLFLGSGDEPLLMVNQADASTFRIVSARHTPGGWSELKVVTDEENQRQSFQPSVVKSGNRLTLVYQTLFTGRRITYQIFRKDSLDGGVTWGPSTRLSNFGDDLSEDPDEIDNQRPTAILYGDNLFVAWERRTARTQSILEVVSYGADGKRIDNQALTQSGFTSRNPLFYIFRDKLNCLV